MAATGGGGIISWVLPGANLFAWPDRAAPLLTTQTFFKWGFSEKGWNDMTRKELAQKVGPEELDNLFLMMARWWAGWPLTRIAEEHGLTVRRVRSLLVWADCHGEFRNPAETYRPDSQREVRGTKVTEAWTTLTHPLAHLLTARQRCALAWRSQSLTLADIARRMGVSPQAVHQLIESAGWRLVWLEMEEQTSEQRRSGDAEEDRLSMEEFGPIDFSDFFKQPADPEVAKPVADGGATPPPVAQEDHP